MTVHISIALDEEQLARLDAMAESRQVSTADLATRVLVNLLEAEAADIAAIEEGLAAVETGDVRDFDEVAADLRAYVAQRMKQATG